MNIMQYRHYRINRKRIRSKKKLLKKKTVTSFGKKFKEKSIIYGDDY